MRLLEIRLCMPKENETPEIDDYDGTGTSAE